MGSTLRRNREFMLVWSGQAISGLGSQISLVAYPLLVPSVTGSPAKAGIVGFAHNLPIAIALGGAPFALILLITFIDGSGFVVTYVAERGALRRLVGARSFGLGRAIRSSLTRPSR